jgi:nucleoside-diphosphate-sugar epimerase
VLRGEPITIDGDGRQSRGNTYVDDCVAATVAALAHGPGQDTFNVGGGEVVSALEALALVERLTGRRAQLRHGPPRLGEQRQALADTTRIRARFGWAPRVGIAEGLAAQVAWQQALLAQAERAP